MSRFIINLIFINLFVAVAYAAISRREALPKSCEDEQCNCVKKYNPVCVNVHVSKKKTMTFDNPCEWICYAKCQDPKSRFLYCGECDHRALPAYGTKLHPEDMKCLEPELFQKHGPENKTAK